MELDNRVYSLIEHQGDLWPLALTVVAPDLPSGPYLLVGSGTSYYLAQTAAALGRQLGLMVDAVPSENMVLEPQATLLGYRTVIVISRSGVTTEAVRALNVAKRLGRTAWALTCNDGTPLTRSADVALVLNGADDGTVVMIQSYTTMLISLQSLWLQTVGRSIDVLRSMENVLPQMVADTRAWWTQHSVKIPRRIYVLGGGVRLGVANEGVLKIQEMSGQIAAAYPPLEFRHGPRGSVQADDLIVLLGQHRFAQHERSVLRDLQTQTQQFLVIAAETWREHVAETATEGIFWNSAVPDDLSGPLAVVPLQLLAWYLSKAAGRDPDHPHNLTKVVQLDYE